MDTIDEKIFEKIENGSPTPQTVEIFSRKSTLKEKKDYLEEDEKALFKDKRTKNLMYMALDEDLFESFFHCSFSK